MAKSSKERLEFKLQLAEVFNSETSRTSQGVRGGRSAPKGFSSTTTLAEMLDGLPDAEQEEIDRSIILFQNKRE